MNIKEFAEKSLDTMLYPTDKEKVSCLTLGLIEEYDEVQYELGKGDVGTTTLISEIGDFAFYVYALGYHFGYLPSERFTGEVIEYEVHIPKLCKLIKKSIRDTNWQIEGSKRLDTFRYLMDVFHSTILDWCEMYELNLSDILSYNVEKLQDRKKRNVITGDGNNR